LYKIKKMSRKYIDIALLVVGIIAVLLAIKTSHDPFPWNSTHPLIEFLEDLFDKFETGNEVIFSLSVGSAVSILFYFLIVWYPERRKRKILRESLKQNYYRFRLSTIGILLHSSDHCCDSHLQQKLNDPKEFRKYFQEDVTGSGERWYDVQNNLEECHLQELRIELEILRDELAYIISQIDISEPKTLDFFKNLSKYVYRMKQKSLEYDDVKSLSGFLWEIFANWDFSTGYVEEDIIEKMIQKI